MECDLCGGQLGQLQTTSFPISITAGQEHHGNFNPLIPEYLLFQIIVLFYFLSDPSPIIGNACQ